jgi:hypothetical protein
MTEGGPTIILRRKSFTSAMSLKGHSRHYARFWHVRSYSNSDQRADVPKSTLCATSRQMQRSKQSGYSITSSARLISECGTARPRILAVSALMTSSNLFACTTGKSPGFAPLRMRPV